jgi:hypothetical protein
VRPHNLDDFKRSIISRFPTILGLLLQVDQNMGGQLTTPAPEARLSFRVHVDLLGALLPNRHPATAGPLIRSLITARITGKRKVSPELQSACQHSVWPTLRSCGLVRVSEDKLGRQITSRTKSRPRELCSSGCALTFPSPRTRAQFGQFPERYPPAKE